MTTGQHLSINQSSFTVVLVTYGWKLNCEVQGLVKKFYLLPCNFLGINGSVVNINVDMHTLNIHLHTREIVYWYLHHIFVCDVRSKEGFGRPETVRINTIIYKDDLSGQKWGGIK